MSGMNEEEIRKETARLLEKFSKSLGRIKKGKTNKEEGKESGFREEGEGETGDIDFRKRMFDNAEKKDENYIYAEKKKW